jgi:hypothetical protein
MNGQIVCTLVFRACTVRSVSLCILGGISAHGEVAEWSKAPVSKTGIPQGIESSNLSLSANRKTSAVWRLFSWRRGAGCLRTLREGFERRSDVSKAWRTASQDRENSCATAQELFLTESLPLRQRNSRRYDAFQCGIYPYLSDPLGTMSWVGRVVKKFDLEMTIR